MRDQYDSILPLGRVSPLPEDAITVEGDAKSGKSEFKTEKTVLRTEDDRTKAKNPDKTENENSKYGDNDVSDDKDMKSKTERTLKEYKDYYSHYVKRMRIMVIMCTVFILVFAVVITAICFLIGFVDVFGLFEKHNSSLLVSSTSGIKPVN